MSECSETTAPAVRVLVVYQHPFLRDLLIRVLDSSGIDIVAAIRSEDFSPLLVNTLKPQTIVVDQAAFGGVESAVRAVVLSSESESPARVVVISLSDTNMLVWRKQVVVDADVQKLVSAVRESVTPCAVSSGVPE